MTNEDLKNLAQAAYAAYFDLLAGVPDTERLKDGGRGMSPFQATAFAGRHTVALPTLHDSASDLDVTVFKDAAGALTLGIRGTLPGHDLTVTDKQIAFEGAAYDQIVALYNWWQRVSTAGGQVSQFAFRSYTTSSSVPPANATPGAVYLYADTSLAGPNGEVVATHYYLEPATSVAATGELVPLLAADPDHKIDVVGHSLGGHLALAFNALFGSSVGQVVGFDTPGFKNNATNQQFFATLGGAVPTGANSATFLNVIADEASVGGAPFNAISGLHSRPGIAVDIAIEDQWLSDEPLPEDARNHSMRTLADSLAVFDLLSRLDLTLTTAQYKALLAGAAQGTAAGYERLIDGIEGVLNINQALLAVGNGEREALYQALYDVQVRNAFLNLAGKLRLDPSSGNLGVKARNDFAALASLITLSPVVLAATDGNQGALDATLRTVWGQTYLDWEADKTMSQADRDAGKETFTSRWIDDRAVMLQGLTLRNMQNSVSGIVVDRSQASSTNFVDVGQGLQFQMDNTANTPVPAMRRNVKFGGSGADPLAGNDQNDGLYGGAGADTLTGLAGADHLEGNAGADTLDGGSGNDTLLGGTDDDFLEGSTGADTLLGGAGSDTYFFNTAGWGDDVIIDSDGQGSLRVPGYDAGLPQGKRQPNGKYETPTQDVTYTVQQITPPAKTSTSSSRTAPTPSPSATGARGAGHHAGRQHRPLVPNYVDTGDAQPNRLTAFHDPDGAGPLEGEYVRDVSLAGGQGDDTVLGYIGNDILQGGAGSDIVLGEASVIVVTSPPAGEPGDDRIFGDGEVEIDSAIAQGNADAQRCQGRLARRLDDEDGHSSSRVSWRGSRRPNDEFKRLESVIGCHRRDSVGARRSPQAGLAAIAWSDACAG
ncbi:MAG: hypothetical protein HS128_12425 [Ideonella sp.]|nr:hypothetical protein [Ideonella sp.]